jgi:hypothetical protein
MSIQTRPLAGFFYYLFQQSRLISRTPGPAQPFFYQTVGSIIQSFMYLNKSSMYLPSAARRPPAANLLKSAIFGWLPPKQAAQEIGFLGNL